VYGFPEPFLRNRKPRTYWCYLSGWAGGKKEQELDRVKRIRFPVTEKRMNMLLSLKPLVCF
jgi:hypothetical protein